MEGSMDAIGLLERFEMRSSTDAKLRKRAAPRAAAARREVEASPTRNGRVVLAPSACCAVRRCWTEKRTTARFRRPPALVSS